MKVAITGGHISPALAVIEALGRDVDIVFLGRKHAFEGDQSISFEYQEITKQNIPFFDLKTGRLQRTLTKKGLTSLLKIPKGFFSARVILQNEKPDVIVSFGGYLGLPVVYAGKTLGIPSVIHEQTLDAGISNKLCSKIAAKVCISWEQSRQYFPKGKTILTGNPLRREILSTLDQTPKHLIPPMIYVTGGSAGSHQVNQIIKKNVEKLLGHYQIVHQTGDAREYEDFDELSRLRDSLPSDFKKRYTILKFVTGKNAASYISSSDLVIGRSGINTISELLYLQKKSLLIPLTHGQIGEQMTNAKFLRRLGLSEIYSDDMDFVETVDRMMKSKNYTLKTPYNTALFRDAACKIVEVIYDASKKTKA